ncbi:MAG TPA: DUF6279 family lipoprotein [Spongiibacteraceae bacterium]|nr:DUF6279 family lipoprotein [Spongiibacteraceae bacterium]
MKRCLLLGLCALLASCSAVKTGYRMADWWIAWTVDDYVRWDAVQQRRFDAELHALLDWHQRTQLPRYRDWFLSLRAELRQPVSIARLQVRGAEVEGFARDIAVQALPAAARLLASLSAEQRAELARALAKQQKKLAREYLKQSDVRRTKQRMKTLVSNLQRFTGRLNGEQRALIRAWAGERGGATALWLANRQQWIEQFLSAVNTHRDAAGLEQALYPLFVDPQTLHSQTYGQALAASQQRLYALLAELHASGTDQQRERLDANLGKWARWMEELAQERLRPDLAHAP